MELRWFRYFLMVVREENISRAAELLHITQPTLSRQMSQLEEAAGTQLFVRGKHLQLTEAGLMLRHRAEEVVQLMDKIQSELQDQENMEGTINIGIGGQKAVAFIMECLDDFQQLYPKVKYDVYTNNADNIKEYLERGLLDFGVLLEPVDISRYDYFRLDDKDRWGLLMPADSPLAAKDCVTMKDMLTVPIITTKRQFLHKEIRNWVGDEFDKLKIKATYDIITNVASLVACGKAYAFTLDGAVALCDPARLTFRPLQPELSMSSVLAWKKFKPGYNLVWKFLEYFQQRHEARHSL